MMTPASIVQDKAKEIAFFDAHAASDEYDVFTPASNERLIAAFVRLSGLPRGARVADLGCGSGAFTEQLRRAGFAAGPCLVKDTMQLSAFASNRFGLGHAALLINEGLVLHVIDDVKRHRDLANTTIGLLGMAFKAESDDVRASLSYKFKNMLNGLARAVLTTDPFVTTDPELMPLETVIDKSDLMILCAPHAVYAQTDFKGKPVYDVWGQLTGANIIR